MFTGIIEEMGTVLSLRMRESEARLEVKAHKVSEGTKLGDSIAVNGVCLTVTELTAHSFSAGLMPETLQRTNLGRLHPGHVVNLERALAFGERLGGHLVQGHVDAMGKVQAFARQTGALLVTIGAPPEVMRYVVPQGFIAVDGVSLTVASSTDSAFTVSLVAYTQEHIALTRQRVGYMANLEVDILGKYVGRMLGKTKPETEGLTTDLLREHGYF